MLALAPPSILVAQGSRTPHADSIRAEFRKSATKFFERWGEAWLASEADRLRRASRDRQGGRTSASQRLPYLHCHADGIGGAVERSRPLAAGYSPVRSDFTPFSVCPTWLLGRGLDLPDESRTTDAGLSDARRATIRRYRATVIEQVANGSRSLPGDDFLVGQHVRLLLDQQLPDSALSVANRCGASGWWCAALRGYVHHASGSHPLAESAFASARASMPPLVRCVWDDVSALLPEVVSSASAGSSCAARLDLSARYWWLADPLYSEPGNERLLEHDARQTLLALRSAFPTDGRTRWDPRFGGDAVARMIVRYGWPTGIAWGGRTEDENHSVWLTRQEAPEQPPYTTYEYTRGRVHTAAAWWAVQAPFSAHDSAWQLTDPSEWAKSAQQWWPGEHFGRARTLSPIEEGQLAVFRRQSDVFVAMAHHIDSATRSRLAREDTAILLASPAPGQFIQLETRPLPVVGPLVMRGRMSAQPAILAVEVRGSATAIDARVRRGLVPPLPLDSMRSGEHAVSAPVFLRPVAVDVALARGDSIVDLMHGSTRLRHGADARVGLYWESYGFLPTDSVNVSIRIEGKDKRRLAQRIREALPFVDRKRSELTIAWREPNPTLAHRTLEGRVAVIGRAVLLDLTPLATGSYELVVRMQRPGDQAAESRREFRIDPSLLDRTQRQ